MIFAPVIAGGTVEHTGGKRRRAIANGISRQSQGDISNQRALLILFLDRNAKGVGLGAVQPGCHRRTEGDVATVTRLNRQVAIVSRFERDFDFQHGRQARIAVIAFGTGVRLIHFAQGVIKDPFHLPFSIVRGPIQHVHGVPQVIGIGGAKLKVNQKRFVGRGAIHAKGELVQPAASHNRCGSQVNFIRHAVIIVVKIKNVIVAVFIGVPASVSAGGCQGSLPISQVNIFQSGTFDHVGLSVAIGIGVERVEVPEFAGVVLKAAHFRPIADIVAVAVGVERVGSQIVGFDGVEQTVAVAVGGGVGGCPVCGQSGLRLRGSGKSRSHLRLSQRIARRVEIRTVKFFPRLARYFPIFPFLLVFSVFGGLLLRKGVYLMAAQQGRTHHRGNHQQNHHRIDCARFVSHNYHSHKAAQR